MTCYELVKKVGKNRSNVTPGSDKIVRCGRIRGFGLVLRRGWVGGKLEEIRMGLGWSEFTAAVAVGILKQGLR